MKKTNRLKFAFAEIKGSLNEWTQAIKEFGNGNSSPEGINDLCNEISRRIDEAAIRIQSFVRSFKNNLQEIKRDKYLLTILPKSIRYASAYMDEAVQEGTDAMIEHFKNSASVLFKWVEVCYKVELFAGTAADELADLRSKYPGVLDEVLSNGSDDMEETAKLALDCRESLGDLHD
jgi:gas vesicle protein